jgi:hypothetical protein
MHSVLLTFLIPPQSLCHLQELFSKLCNKFQNNIFLDNYYQGTITVFAVWKVEEENSVSEDS